MSDCDQTFLVTTESYKNDTRIRLALLQVITRQNFKEAQKGGNASAEIPVKGIPLKFFGSYDEFSRARDEEFSLYKFDYDNNSSLAFARSYLSDTAAKEWIDCKRLEASKNGVYIWPTEIARDKVIIRVRWTNSAANGPQKPTHITVRGSDTNPTDLMAAWISGAERSQTFNRLVGQDFSCVINLAGDTDSFSVPFPPQIAVRETQVRVGPSIEARRREFNSTKEDQIVASPGWTFDLSSAQMVLEVSQNNRAAPEHLMRIRSDKSNENLLVYAVTSNAATKDLTGITRAHPVVTEQRWIIKDPPLPPTQQFEYFNN